MRIITRKGIISLRRNSVV